MELRCDKIVITGGGSGIGLAVAKRFTAAGAQVVICGRHIEKLKKAAEEIASPLLQAMEWDIADTENIPAKLAEAALLMGGLNGVVNAAALGSSDVTGRGYDPWDITPEEFDRLVGVNLKGAYFVLRDSIDYMEENGIRGNILSFASNAACMDISGTYGLSKLSVVKLTRCWAKRAGEKGIILNGIAPGATFTPMIRRYAHSVDQPYPRHAIGRFIRPEEIAELAAYLMSPWGEIICGHTVVADGGDKNATL